MQIPAVFQRKEMCCFGPYKYIVTNNLLTIATFLSRAKRGSARYQLGSVFQWTPCERDLKEKRKKTASTGLLYCIVNANLIYNEYKFIHVSVPYLLGHMRETHMFPRTIHSQFYFFHWSTLVKHYAQKRLPEKCCKRSTSFCTEETTLGFLISLSFIHKFTLEIMKPSECSPSHCSCCLSLSGTKQKKLTASSKLLVVFRLHVLFNDCKLFALSFLLELFHRPSFILIFLLLVPSAVAP